MRNKRKMRRVPVDIYLNKFVAGVPYMARASDISSEGVSLAHLIEPQHHKKRVGLQFQLPGSEEVIYAEGEVVREWLSSRAADGSGVRFTLLTERHRRLIDAFVAENGREE
jgi:PilZ domain